MKFLKLSDITKVLLIHHMMGVEGGEKYTNIKEDRGGKTKFGVTEDTINEPEYKPLWKKHNFSGQVKDITFELAYDVYEQGWWNRLRMDDLMAINPVIAERVFDIGINSGRGRAGEYLQRIINLFNDNQRLYPDIVVDGGIGTKTIAALKNLIQIRKSDPNVYKVIALQLYTLQSAAWFNFAEKSKDQEKFSWGWANRSVNAIDTFYDLL